MKSTEFCYWLQGFFELDENGPKQAEKKTLTAEQTECIRRHLSLVFKHEIDPSYGDKKQQEVLQNMHDRFDPALNNLDVRIKC